LELLGCGGKSKFFGFYKLQLTGDKSLRFFALVFRIFGCKAAQVTTLNSDAWVVTMKHFAKKMPVVIITNMEYWNSALVRPAHNLDCHERAEG
jgi:hypothetical protein